MTITYETAEFTDHNGTRKTYWAYAALSQEEVIAGKAHTILENVLLNNVLAILYTPRLNEDRQSYTPGFSIQLPALGIPFLANTK